MRPTLSKIRIVEISEAYTSIGIWYLASSDADGIELMGMDAGLSWLKGESLELILEESTPSYATYYGQIDLEDTCDFRARAYIGEEDFWEEGQYELTRLDNGQFKIDGDEVALEQVEIRNQPPVIYDRSMEEIQKTIENIGECNLHLFQVLYEVSNWIRPVMQQPFDNPHINLLPPLVRFLKEKTRELDSHMVDEVARPIYDAVFHIYLSTKTFHGEDNRLLTGEWEHAKYGVLFTTLENQIKDLEKDTVGSKEDKYDRFLALLKYV